jgi:hypothetical protein
MIDAAIVGIGLAYVPEWFAVFLSATEDWCASSKIGRKRFLSCTCTSRRGANRQQV